MVPRKVRTFWRTVQICWEFRAQSLFLCSAQKRKQSQRYRTWLSAERICSSSCPSQPTESPLREGETAQGPLWWCSLRATLSAGWFREPGLSLDCRDILLLAEIFPAQILPLTPSTPLAWSTGESKIFTHPLYSISFVS